MTIKIHNLEEMKDYYNEETKTYMFWGDNGFAANVVLYFDLKVDANIFCHNLLCDNIKVLNINANDIDAVNLESKKVICHNLDAIKIICDEIILDGDDGEINAYSKLICKRIKAERVL